MTLTNAQILSLSDAITLLDGQHRIEVIDGKPTQVFHGYKIPHKARWNLARDLGLLRVAINDFNRAKDSLLFSLSDGKGQLGPNDGEKFNLFVRDLESMKQEEVSINLLTITEADLVENDIPSAFWPHCNPSYSSHPSHNILCPTQPTNPSKS